MRWLKSITEWIVREFCAANSKEKKLSKHSEEKIFYDNRVALYIFPRSSHCTSRTVAGKLKIAIQIQIFNFLFHRCRFVPVTFRFDQMSGIHAGIFS